MTQDEQVTLREHMDSRLDAIGTEMRAFNHRLIELRDEAREIREENRRDHNEVRVLIGDTPTRLVGVETSVDLLGSGQAKLDERVDQIELRESRLAGSITAMKVVGGIALTLVAGAFGAFVNHFLA